MKLRRTGRKTAAVALFAGVMFAGSIALAAWISTGTGSGAAKAITATDLVVVNGTAVADLYPGFNNGDLELSVTNPNPYAVQVTSVQGTATAITSNNATCDTNGNGVTMDSGSVPVGPVSIGAGATVNIAVDDVMNMSTAADNACQGATFQVPITVSGTSA